MRDRSLDAFRGLTVLLMLLVNNLPPGAPAWMGHGPFGKSLYLADWVFPWFLVNQSAHFSTPTPHQDEGLGLFSTSPTIPKGRA